jgi:hypothetical protein
MNTLIQQAKTICNEDSLDVEISHLKGTFKYNRYSSHEVMRVLAPKTKGLKHRKRS